MKRTFITNMPDEAGAFLKASRIISDIGANITRVSYNKAVDMHMLFLDVSGTEEQLERVGKGLERVGYAQNPHSSASVIFLEFKLEDTPGAVTPILELIQSYDFNIAYISSQGNGTEYQYFKMGLFVESPPAIKSFLDRATKLCEVRVVEYSYSEKLLDNTIFYLGFASEMKKKLDLTDEETQELITQSNLLMQLLDEKDELPQKTFGYIGRFAEIIHAHQGASFQPRVSRYDYAPGITLYMIEPPCGSNTYILEQNEELLFVDCGFARYKDEMMALFAETFPEFSLRKKSIAITHPDIDHCGLLHLFSAIYVTKAGKENFLAELNGEPNSREKNPAHAPYSRISRILSGYVPPAADSLRLITKNEPKEQERPLVPIGSLSFGDITFEVHRGNGGHAIGEVVLVDKKNRAVFSGDIVINAAGSTEEQKEFNKLAPYLMTSVNMNSALAKEERDELLATFDPNDYTYYPGHGAVLGTTS